MFPEARKEALIVTEVDDELIVYDEKRRRAVLLNPVARCIWQNCDGKTSPEAIAVRMSKFEDVEAATMVVQLGLKRLGQAGLLQSPAPGIAAPSVTRRTLLSRVGVAAGLLLPVITFLAAPTPAMAGSVFGGITAFECAGLGPSFVCGGQPCVDGDGNALRRVGGNQLYCNPGFSDQCACQ